MQFSCHGHLGGLASLAWGLIPLKSQLPQSEQQNSFRLEKARIGFRRAQALMDSGTSPQIAMVTLPGQTSTSFPHSDMPANFAQPSQPPPLPGHALEQSGSYPNQSNWPAPANNVPQYTAAPVGSPGSLPEFSIRQADEEPWR